MIRDYDYENYGTSIAAPKYDHCKEPMPSREELLARNSFGSVNDNKYLKTQRQLDIAAAEAQLAKLRAK
jgi:hypothetical protein